MKKNNDPTKTPKGQKIADKSADGSATQTVAEQPFKMGEGRFRRAFENAPIGMAIVDFQYRIKRVNKALCKALGYPAKELIDRRFVDITYPDDVRKDRELAEKLFRDEIPSYRLEKRFVTKDGAIAWLDLTALMIRDEAEKPLYGLAMVEDITERRRTQEALRTSEERYRSFVVNSSEGIWRIESEQPIDIKLPPDDQINLFYKYGYVAECNDATARMYGHDRAEDLIGSRFGEFALTSQEQYLHFIRSFVMSGYRLQHLRTEELDLHGNKKFFACSLIGIVINDQLLRVWGVQRDRTEQRKAEIDLARSHQQLRALTAYLNSIRERERIDIAREMHDVLGQSLTSLKIEVSLLKKKLAKTNEIDPTELDSKLTELNEMLETTISSVKTLSTELRPGVLDKFGLAAAIEWQCDEFSRRTKIDCECQIPQNEFSLPPEFSTALFRILQEALTNVARHSEATLVRVILALDDEGISLTISDDGRGITEAELRSPTSLGLLGMRERAEFPGGSFNVTGRPGEGTVLTARFPLTKAKGKSAEGKK